MAGNKGLFDNIMKKLKGAITLTGTTLVSLEIDFELPRGFIAKIHNAIIKFTAVVEDIEGLGANKLIRARAVLVKDPDDSASIVIPNNRVDHDVLMETEMEIVVVAGTAGDTVFSMTNTDRQENFSAEGLDVFTARNMRLNCQGLGTDGADLTETLGNAVMGYTLEQISDDQIINLLDIL